MQTFDIKATGKLTISNDDLMIIKLYKTGLGRAEIAEISSLPAMKVQKTLYTNGMLKNKRNNYKNERDRTRDMYSLGVSSEFICKRYNISIDTFNEIVGIPKPLTFGKVAGYISNDINERNRKIRALWKQGNMSYPAIGKMFGITGQRVGQIVRNV